MRPSLEGLLIGVGPGASSKYKHARRGQREELANTPAIWFSTGSSTAKGGPPKFVAHDSDRPPAPKSWDSIRADETYTEKKDRKKKRETGVGRTRTPSSPKKANAVMVEEVS